MPQGHVRALTRFWAEIGFYDNGSVKFIDKDFLASEPFRMSQAKGVVPFLEMSMSIERD